MCIMSKELLTMKQIGRPASDDRDGQVNALALCPGVYACLVSYYPTLEPATPMFTNLELCMSERMMLDHC